MRCRRHGHEWCDACLWLSRDELDALERSGGEADAVAVMCEALASIRDDSDRDLVVAGIDDAGDEGVLEPLVHARGVEVLDGQTHLYPVVANAAQGDTERLFVFGTDGLGREPAEVHAPHLTSDCRGTTLGFA